MNARCSVTGSGCGNTAFTGYLLNGKTRPFGVYQEWGRELPSLVKLESNARCSVTGSGCGGNTAFTS
ncbi:hypothetical protein CesoFtcFv8_014391 [Champsocephalus esox]|uniref:Uncharacterized protein n=1 Tax=Champsocephalus esox TaxID=159716 RepID=A0AAN8BS87_9TELE|nr:hypothetical protein CesoFtcFv8_014391 [Champsocephalus esox]